MTGPRARTGGAEEPDNEDSLQESSGGVSGRRVLFLVVAGIVSFGFLLGVWLGLAGAVDVEDLTAGAVAAAVAIGIGFVLSHSGRAVPRLRAGDVARIARFPVQLVVESAQVFIVAARKAVRRDAPGGCWAEVPVEVTGTGWAAARRESVVTVLMSATPKTVVADVNLGTGTALVHRLGGGDQAGCASDSSRSAPKAPP